MKTLISFALAFLFIASTNAHAFCEAEAIQAAKLEAASILGEPLSQLSATVFDSDFNETYGRGEYTIDVEGKTNVLTFYVEMIAYSNADDTAYTCELSEIQE